MTYTYIIIDFYTFSSRLIKGVEKAKAGVSAEKLPKIYGIIKKNVNTNIPPGDLLSVYRAYKDFRLSGTKRFTLPGEPALIDGSSYWKPDVWQGRKMLRQEN